MGKRKRNSEARRRSKQRTVEARMMEVAAGLQARNEELRKIVAELQRTLLNDKT
jgi:hypothetical protein